MCLLLYTDYIDLFGVQADRFADPHRQLYLGVTAVR